MIASVSTFRYVREWISAMVCADVVDHVLTDGEDRYWLAPYRLPTLLGKGLGGTALGAQLVTGVGDNCSNVEKCFPIEGPLGLYSCTLYK